MLKFSSFSVASNVTLSADVLSAYITKFWKDEFNPLHIKNAKMHLLKLTEVNFKHANIKQRAEGPNSSLEQPKPVSTTIALIVNIAWMTI